MIKQLPDMETFFFNLTPATLSVIVADLSESDDPNMLGVKNLADAAGRGCWGDEFDDLVNEAHEFLAHGLPANHDGQREEDESGYNADVADAIGRFQR